MKNRAFTILLSLLLSLAWAPRASSQSTFGIYYIGEHLFGGGSRDRALAYSTMAVPDSTGALAQNLASLADLSRVTLSLMQVYEVNRARTSDQTADLTNYYLPHIMVAVPLGKGLVFGLGYKTGYMGRADFAYPRAEQDIPLYYEVYEHRGSLFTIPLAVAARVGSRIKLSAAYELERGSIRNDVRTEFYDTEYADANSSRDRSFSAESFSGSVLIELHPRLWIGGVWDHEVEYDVREKIEYTRSELDSASSWTMTLPSAFGVGAAIGITERWWLSSQYWVRKAPEPVGFPQFSEGIGDEMMIGFGIERRRVEDGGFFGRLPLRLGFYQNRWHAEVPSGETLISRFVTFGTSFGFPGGPGSIDLSVELGQIGSVDKNGVDERMVRFGMAFSVSETWSRRSGDSWR